MTALTVAINKLSDRPTIQPPEWGELPSLTEFRRQVGLFNDLVFAVMGDVARPISAELGYFFTLLAPSRQWAAIEDLRRYNDILLGARRSGIGLTDDKRLTWFAISRLGLIPCGDTFEMIKDSDYIEIYNTEGIQIFRNLEFCRLISYSIAEITLHPWYLLYGRDGKFSAQIYQQAFVKALSGQRATFRAAIDVHESQERLSVERRRFKIWPGHLSPLFDQAGRPAAILGTSRRQRI